MRKVNVSTKQISKFAGMWIAIDTSKEKIVAASKSFKDIAPLVTLAKNDKRHEDQVPAAFKVPRKNEGTYIL